MEKDSILKISGKKIHEKDISEIKKILENKYEISYGDYSPHELRKAISEHSPFFIQDHFIIGYEDKHFITDKKEKIEIGRMVKAVIIEDETEGFAEDEDVNHPDPACDKRDPFIIMGRDGWEGEKNNLLNVQSIFGNLKVGDLFLPPHSVIINFLPQTDELKKKKIVSMLAGDNINIYSQENFIDNIMHEIGHVFWRDCLKPEEQARVKEYFKFLRVSGIFEYEWERSAPEEFFCTVYKWYLKSLLLNKSFRNILEYEEPEGLKILEEIFDRLRRDKIAAATWSISGKELFDYLNPKLDITTGKRIVKKGTFDSVRDLAIPEQVQAENMERYERGRRMVRFGKAVVPVLNNRIDWQEMEEMRKARMTKYVKKIPKAGGGWRYIYEETDQNNVKKKPEIITELKMKQFINFILDAKEEHALCINDKNEKILYREGDKGRVALTKRMQRVINNNTKLFIHNHTNGTSFSHADIAFMLKHNISTMNIHTKLNNQHLHYSLKLKLFKKYSKEEIGAIVNDYLFIRSQKAADIANKIFFNLISKEEGNKLKKDFSNSVVNDFVIKNKELFDYEKIIS